MGELWSQPTRASVLASAPAAGLQRAEEKLPQACQVETPPTYRSAASILSAGSGGDGKEGVRCGDDSAGIQVGLQY